MIQKTASTDPIIDEIHRTRRSIADRFGGDIRAILADARKRQAASGRATWQPGEKNHPLHQSGGDDEVQAKDISPPSQS